MIQLKQPLIETTSTQNAQLKDAYMKYVSLVALTAQNALEGVAVRHSRTRTQDLYIISTATVMVEVVKLVSSVLLLGGEEKSLMIAFRYNENLFRPCLAYKCIMQKLVVCFSRTIGGAVKKNPWETMKVALISLIYVIQNNLLFFAASNLDVATFQVSYQLKILATALFFVIMLSTKLLPTQWLSLFLLFVGVVLVKLANLQSSSAVSATEDPFVGFCAVIIACCLSGFAGVYFEKVLKSSSASVWLRNVQLSFLSIPLALSLCYSYDFVPITVNGFFFGYDSFVWFVILVKASGGLIVALVVKYANNILKGFSTSIAIVIGCTANVFFFGVLLNVQFVAGTALVICAVFLYGYRPSNPSSEQK